MLRHPGEYRPTHPGEGCSRTATDPLANWPFGAWDNPADRGSPKGQLARGSAVP